MGAPEKLCVPRDSIKRGMRVLIIDDLVATGGSMLTATNLVKSQASHPSNILRYFPLVCILKSKRNKSQGGVVVGLACIIEIKCLHGYRRITDAHPEVK